jgi:hypothetical protein
LQAKKGTTEMKSRMKPALRALPTAQVQITLPVQGVLRDVRHAFLGLCIDAVVAGLNLSSFSRSERACSS